MTTPDPFIVRALTPYTTCRQVDGGTLVTTQCLYPGGDGVSVVIGQGAGGYRVSDQGAGWQALLAAGMIADQGDWKSGGLGGVLSDASDGIRDIADGLKPLRGKYPKEA